MALTAATTLGQASTDCPNPECTNPCVVCEHKQWVFDNSFSLNGNPQDLLALLESILDTHEECLLDICNLSLDICARGELLGFPCVQCGAIPVECIEFGNPVLKVDCITAAPDGCICFQELFFDTCTESVVDLSGPTYLDLYTSIVEALEQLSGGFATGETIINFIRLFLPNADILLIDGGFYNISIGTATDEVLSILPILARLVPIPIGARLKFFVQCGTIGTN